MIQRLRLKFIAIVLTVVLVIILAMGLIINISVTHGTYHKYDNGIDDLYEHITLSSELFDNDNASISHLNDSNLFFVRKPIGEDFLDYDLNNIERMPYDEVRSMAETALNSNSSHGMIGFYRYGVYSDNAGNQTILFQNVKVNIEFLKELRVTTVLVGLIVFIITVVLSIPVSSSVMDTISKQLEAQNEFVTHASHDLKTPITVISANMDVLSLKDKDNPWIQSTKKQVSYMKKLVNNMMGVSKLSEENFSTPFEVIDISTIIEDVSGMFTELIKGKNITFAQEIQQEISYNGSVFYITRLITILCENAVNYTPKNGRIFIEFYKNKNNIYFTITNTRDPNDNLEINKLFDRFYRGDKSRSSDTYGNGLGLSMAKMIVEMHGGTITAKCKTDDTIKFSVILKG